MKPCGVLAGYRYCHAERVIPLSSVSLLGNASLSGLRARGVTWTGFEVSRGREQCFRKSVDWLRRDLLSEYFLSRLQYFIPAGFETFEGWIDLNIGNDANILEATTVQGIDPLSGEVKTPSSGQQDSCDVSCCPFSFSTDQSYMVYPLEHH